MFDDRAKDHEWLDQPEVSHEMALCSYRLMARVNRWLGGARVVQQFVAEELQRRGHAEPLRLLDIGCGAADIPLTLQHWARKRGEKLEIVGLETCKEALAYAHRCLGNGNAEGIELRHESIFEHRPARSYDAAVGSMFFHHLDDETIPALIHQLKTIVAGRLLINDLRRTPAHWLGGFLLTLTLRADARHDALLSIRRGFRADELKRLLQRIEGVRVRTTNRWFFRVAAVVDLHTGDSR